MIMNFSTEIKNVGNMLNKQVKATDNTNDARRTFAIALQSDAVDLTIQEQAAAIKLDVAKAFPKGCGKDADPVQKKAVQAVRQVISTYKKGCAMAISPNNYETYSEYRNAVYNDQPLTKLEQIKKWLDADDSKLDVDKQVTTKALQELLNTYKAIGQ
jgi:hypothetical protein